MASLMGNEKGFSAYRAKCNSCGKFMAATVPCVASAWPLTLPQSTPTCSTLYANHLNISRIILTYPTSNIVSVSVSVSVLVVGTPIILHNLAMRQDKPRHCTWSCSLELKLPSVVAAGMAIKFTQFSKLNCQGSMRRQRQSKFLSLSIVVGCRGT